MRRKQLLLVSIAGLLAIAFATPPFWSAALRVPATATRGTATSTGTPVPRIPRTVAAVPANCCLWQVSKTATGQRTLTYAAPYECDTGQTARAATQIRLGFVTAPPCDQDPTLLPPGSKLEASGNTIRRADGFAVFTGTFTIRDAAGAALISGTMELVDRIGSHQAPFGSEPCDPKNHQEGWLSGEGTGSFSSFRLHAAIAAQGPLPAASGPQSLQVRMIGALVKCP
jgi:hypothetical protein